MANQKRFETVKFTLEQAALVKELIKIQIDFIEKKGLDGSNASQYVSLQNALSLFTKN